MIGSFDRDERRVTVVGAGIAGLLLAERLDELGFEVTLLEGQPRAGGLISTRRERCGIAESAAHSFLATPAVLRHFERLGVGLVGLNPSSKSRFVLRNGKPRRMPLGPGEALGAFFRAYLALSDRRTPPEDLTVEDFARRHLGEAALDYLVSPALTGIYAADPSEISLGAAFPKLVLPSGHSIFSHWLARNVTRRSKHRIAGEDRGGRSRPRMMAPRDGMGAWVSALERKLELRLGGRFKKGYVVDGMPEARNVALCVPADVASRIIGSSDPGPAAALASVVYSPMLSVTAFVEKSAFAREPRGVGVLVPKREGRDALGILFDSSSFEGRVADPARHCSFTLMFGGSRRPDCLGWSDEEVRSRVDRELRDLLGAHARAEEVAIFRWPRAIPLYSPSLTRAWGALRASATKRPGTVFFGNYTGQVSLRGMIETVSALE